MSKAEDYYQSLSVDKLDTELDAAISERNRMTSVTMRMPAEMLRRLKEAAEEADVPYQRYMRELIEAGWHTRSARRRARPARVAVSADALAALRNGTPVELVLGRRG